ncbi:conserved hypothetical protein [Tenacibaculum finnmarkense genomovar ulcerans]|uniref:Uncharacterized protein n=1 Tax=Tenacibaculum finnmarkense genomovar ulcerans TaxID=2781388 RepID=A0A2I2M804_9FLAO|nr:hypothetical protein [Tenacibaculum finnmarkense]SOU88679.1 conserved hypothetical protein [Tenacibaculum finnmarkense genomovar ulcerans]
MIDYTKILLQYVDVTRLLELPFLSFSGTYETKTGEQKNNGTLIADYHFCKIAVYESGLVLFTGSLHKMYNSIKGIVAPNHKRVLDKIKLMPISTPVEQQQQIEALAMAKSKYKGYNGNTFDFDNIVEVRRYLELLFNCEPQQMILQNIEFGVNTTPDFNSKLFLKGLLFHKNKEFEYRFNGSFAQSIHQQYYIKIYDKAKQYGMIGNVLRVELKIVKSEYLKQLCIVSFKDINTTTLNNAREFLLKAFNEVVYYDYTIDKKSLTDSQKQSLNNYSNPRYWLHNLKPIHRDRPKKKLHNFIVNYSDNLKAKIYKNIKQKCVTINSYLKPKKEVIKKQKCVTINSSSIGINITQYQPPKNLKCKYTNLPLIHEKKGVNNIGIATLKYLRKNEPKTFDLLCSIWIKKTKVGTCKYENTKEKRILKAIRNKHRKKITSTGYRKKKYNNPNQIKLI